MLQLRFFASIREHLGTGELRQPFAADCASVASLVQTLDAGPLPGCARWLLVDNTIVERIGPWDSARAPQRSRGQGVLFRRRSKKPVATSTI